MNSNRKNTMRRTNIVFQTPFSPPERRGPVGFITGEAHRTKVIPQNVYSSEDSDPEYTKVEIETHNAGLYQIPICEYRSSLVVDD